MEWVKIVADAVIWVLLVWLILLYKGQAKFFRERTDTLVKEQQALREEASALKTFTDRFLSLLAELSPEKLVIRVKAVEELVEKEAKASLADAERQWKRQLEEAQAAKETQEQTNKRLLELAKEHLQMSGEATGRLAIALYNLPRGLREGILSQIQRPALKEMVQDIYSGIEGVSGPSPADQPPPVSELARLLMQGPPRFHLSSKNPSRAAG